MVESKIRILGIAPYDGMRTAMERAAENFPRSSWTLTPAIWRRALPSCSGCRPIPIIVSSPAAARRR